MEDEVDQEEERERFTRARDGDHLMVPFQCDLCHFRNIQLRDPGSGSRDGVLLVAIRRAILDSFWSRERSTVEGNMRQRAHFLRACEAFGVDEHRYGMVRGPFPVKDEWGMLEAATLLYRSEDAGRNIKTIQFNTMRKLRSFYSNHFHAGAGGVGMASLTGENGGRFFTDSNMFGFWFKRFIEGCHRRMGDNIKLDRAVTIDEMLSIQEMLEEDWITAPDTESPLNTMERVAGMAVMFLVGFGGGLRGEEIVKADLATSRDYLSQSLSHVRFPHVTLGLKGRVKGETKIRCHLLPLALRTHSGLEIGKWFQRLLDVLERRGVTRGWLFQTGRGRTGTGPRKRPHFGEFEGTFRDYLRRLQVSKPHVLHPSVDVEEEFSLRRSLRRGSTAQARNRKVPGDVVETNNRWRKVERAGGKQASLGMMEHYSDVRAGIEALLQYSEAM